MQIVGDFSDLTFQRIARMIGQARLSGTMIIRMSPERWVTFVRGDVDMVDREDGVLRGRVAAWLLQPDPVEQYRLRKDRLMELVLVAGSGAPFEFWTGDVVASGLPPFDLEELDARALRTRTAAPEVPPVAVVPPVAPTPPVPAAPGVQAVPGVQAAPGVPAAPVGETSGSALVRAEREPAHRGPSPADHGPADPGPPDHGSPGGEPGQRTPQFRPRQRGTAEVTDAGAAAAGTPAPPAHPPRGARHRALSRLISAVRTR